jgi:hypothetical protein
MGNPILEYISRNPEYQPAFPIQFVEVTTGAEHVYFGLTQRQYFAGQALAGLAARADLNRAPDIDAVADFAVQLADAMVERLKR